MATICLTGATGFIGRNLLDLLENSEHELVALSRRIPPRMNGAKKNNITWKKCNGFSLIDAEKATEGVDILVYLIHSMLPTSSLSQGSFSDFDLYLADNFARACKKNKVKKIIYLSGLIPDAENLSTHLESRLEVERTLTQYNNDLTVLRAGLIVGENGSSFKILERLVKRLPAFICPSWTLSKCQPIDVKDVLASLAYCLNHYQELNPVYDIGGPDILTYRGMLQETAQVLGKSRPSINVPYFSPGLSKLWVSKVTSTSSNLVYPLVESLKHNMVVNKDKQLILPHHTYKTFRQSLEKGLTKKEDGWVWNIINYSTQFNIGFLENVTSMQRVSASAEDDALEIAQEYFKWLPQFMRPLIQVKVNKARVVFSFLGFINLITLIKSADRSGRDRVVYYITKGVLARRSTLNGRLEFRWVASSNSVIIALHDFRPALPWFIYKYTQALVHLFVMRRFQKHIRFKK